MLLIMRLVGFISRMFTPVSNAVVVRAGLDRHHHFFKCSIPGSFA